MFRKIVLHNDRCCIRAFKKIWYLDTDSMRYYQHFGQVYVNKDPKILYLALDMNNGTHSISCTLEEI